MYNGGYCFNNFISLDIWHIPNYSLKHAATTENTQHSSQKLGISTNPYAFSLLIYDKKKPSKEFRNKPLKDNF